MEKREHVGAVLRPPVEGTAEDFFRSLKESAALPVGVEADEATSIVLCALLARLSLEQARRVLDALPGEVTAVAGRCPIHGGAAGEALGKLEFLEGIGQHLQLAPEGVERMARAVLHALRAHLPPYANGIVEGQLPAGLLDLWRRQRSQ
jgi:uncharacterized protein (DUF2267 family)